MLTLVMTRRKRTAFVPPSRRGGWLWFRRPVARPAQAVGSFAIGSFALGMLATGAVAVGTLAIGRLAIGRLALREGRIKRLRIDELEVGQYRLLRHEPEVVAAPNGRPVREMEPAGRS